MKNVLFGLFLLSSLSLALVSCDDDDDKKGGGSKPNIKGEWLLTKEVYKNCDDTDDNESYDVDCSGDGECSYVTFNADGSVTMNSSDFDISGTYTQSGNKLTICFFEDLCETVTIKKDGNKLVVYTSDEDWGCDIEETYTLVK